MVDERLGVGEPTQRFVPQDLAEMHLDLGPCAPQRFPEQQREPEGRADMAGDLEQPAVLTLEMDRQDRGLRTLDQPADEGGPIRVQRRGERAPIAMASLVEAKLIGRT